MWVPVERRCRDPDHHEEAQLTQQRLVRKQQPAEPRRHDQPSVGNDAAGLGQPEKHAFDVAVPELPVLDHPAQEEDLRTKENSGAAQSKADGSADRCCVGSLHGGKGRKGG